MATQQAPSNSASRPPTPQGGVPTSCFPTRHPQPIPSTTANLATNSSPLIPDVLQWNCRSLGMSANELGELFRYEGQPTVLLLQETRGTTPGVPGYFGFFSPSIKRQGRRGEPDLVQAQAAVFVRRDVHHLQIDTAEYCTEFQEVVAVRCRLDKNREVIFASVYLRPETSRRSRGNFSWLRQLRVRYPKDRILVAGDFNAHHPHWGYKEATPRGRHLEEEAEAADLVLANDLDYPTRHALHSNQKDSIPDLTWATAGFVTDWRCDSDPRGSDHYPIWISLNVRARARHARTTKVTDWTQFRLALETTMEEDEPVVDRILGAAKGATTEIELTENTPNPDKHLLHLWEDRSKLHAEYLNNRRTHKDLV